MKLHGLKNCLMFAVSALWLHACASTPDIYQAAEANGAERPPNPEIDLDEWGKPGSPPTLPAEPDLNIGKVKPIRRLPPQFPERAFSLGVCRGRVDLEFDVTDDGRPTNIRIVDSTASVFNISAIRAVETWQFERKTSQEPLGYRTGLQTFITFEGCPE